MAPAAAAARVAVVTALRAGWGVGCLNSAAVPPDLVVLSEKDPKRWPSPGRLAFYGQARPAAASRGRTVASFRPALPLLHSLVSPRSLKLSTSSPV